MSSQPLQDVSRTLREELPHFRDNVHRIAHDVFHSLRFTNIRVRPSRSWYGDEVVDVWAICEGEVEALEQAEGLISFPRRVRDLLWDPDLEAAPSIHLITQSEAGDWRPEGRARRGPLSSSLGRRRE